MKETEEINYLTHATCPNASCKFQSIKICSRRRRRRRRGKILKKKT
jgi:hypothetical protein